MRNVDVRKIQVRLFDDTGNLVKIIESAEPVLLQIDLTGSGKGIYVIQLIGKEFNTTEKVIVQ